LKTEEKYRSLVENSTDSVFVVDYTGHFIFANEAWLKLTGYTLDGLEQLRFNTLLADDVQQPFFQSADDLQGPSHDYPQEYIIKRKDGTSINVEINSQIIRKKRKTVRDSKYCP